MGFSDLLNCAIRSSVSGGLESSPNRMNRAVVEETNSHNEEILLLNKTLTFHKKKAMKLEEEVKQEKYLTLHLRDKSNQLEKELKSAREAKGLLERDLRDQTQRRRELEKQYFSVKRNYELDHAAFNRVTQKNEAFLRRLVGLANKPQGPWRPQSAGAIGVRRTKSNVDLLQIQAPLVIPEDAAKSLVEEFRSLVSSVKQHTQNQQIVSDALAEKAMAEEEKTRATQLLLDMKAKVDLAENQRITSAKNCRRGNEEVNRFRQIHQKGAAEIERTRKVIEELRNDLSVESEKHERIFAEFASYKSVADEKIHSMSQQLFHSGTELTASQSAFEKVADEAAIVRRECTTLNEWRSQCGVFFKEKYNFEEERIRALEKLNDRFCLRFSDKEGIANE